MMDLFGYAVTACGTLIGLFGTLIMWVALSPDKRTELKQLLKNLWTHATKVVVILMALFTTGMNIWEIYLFGAADTPPTRADFLVLLMHIWNASSYFFCGMVLFAFWMKDLIAKEYPVQAQT